MRLFVEAPERSTRAHVLRTLAQASAFWAAFVVAAPLVLVTFERELIGPLMAPHPAVGAILVVVMGALNVWAGLTMAVVGQGTPFPSETARLLVVKGPYRFVRNPMAIGGLGAGLGMAFLIGSAATIALVVVGALLWHVVARPLEERDLEARFGDAYRRYRAEVACWWPRRAPFGDAH